MTKKNKNSGFTLIEVLIAVILIGIGIAALVAASANFTELNGEGIDMSTAEFLMEQIRELTLSMDFDLKKDGYELRDILAESSYPINANSDELTDFADWSQVVDVNYVSDSNLADELTSGTSNFKRITVEVLHNGKPITSSSWIRAKY